MSHIDSFDEFYRLLAYALLDETILRGSEIRFVLEEEEMGKAIETLKSEFVPEYRLARLTKVLREIDAWSAD